MITVPFSDFGAKSLMSARANSILSATPARIAFSFAVSRVCLFISKPYALKSLSVIISLSAFSRSLSQISYGINGNRSEAK